MNARRLTSTILTVLCALAGVLALSPAPASALVVHRFKERITWLNTPLPAEAYAYLFSPKGVAIDNSTSASSGDVYVANSKELKPGGLPGGAVDKLTGGPYSSAGSGISSVAYVCQITGAGSATGTQLSSTECDKSTPGTPTGSFKLAYWVAVDQSNGALYVSDWQEKAVYKFDASGAYLSEIGESIAPSGASFIPEGVAVDRSSGDVYVADEFEKAVDKFKEEPGGSWKYVCQITGAGSSSTSAKECNGKTGSSVPSGKFGATHRVAVDNSTSASSGDVYITDDGNHVVDKFTSSGAYVSQLTGPEAAGGPAGSGSFGAVEGLAVDQSNGDVYVGQYHQAGGTVVQFDSSGHYVSEIGGFQQPADIAVDRADGDVYVTDGDSGAVNVFGPGVLFPDVRTGAASNEKQTTATVEGVVNPDGLALTSCEFEYGTTPGYGQSAPCSPSPGSVNEDVTVHADLNGLRSGVTYYFRLLAANANGANAGKGGTFKTEPPAIDGEWVMDVMSTGATLEAEVNPVGVEVTACQFEYGTSTSYEKTAACSPSPGSGTGDVTVAAPRLQGLSPHSTYHYRVAVTNEFGTVDGEDQTFTTQTVGGELTLPDGREWEMVSPPQKHGALIFLYQEGITKASADGSAITYMANSPTENEPQGYGTRVSVLSARGSGGWSSQDLALPNEGEHIYSLGEGTEYRFFSEDLSRAFVQPYEPAPRLSPEASESTAYLRTDYFNGDVSDRCVTGCYQPLVTAANVPPGTVFGEEPPAGTCTFRCGPSFLDATPDGSHVVLYSCVALTETPAGCGLYEWAEGKLQLVSVLPKDEGGGASGGYPSLGDGRTGAARHAISNDGSRIIWEDYLGGTSSVLYLRDTVKGETVKLGIGIYMTASSDGSRIFFLNGGRGGELYEYNLNAPEGSRLSDLSGFGVTNVLGASEDGSYVYFDSGGGLYVHHAGTTKPTLIASLSGNDSPDWANGTNQLTKMTSRVSPNGLWLAFMSQLDLTGYDNRDAISGQPDEEVYLYNAETGKLVCASCNPTGARPVGVEYGRGSEKLFGGDRVWESSTWIAANIPTWNQTVSGRTRYQPRYLSDSGRLFFNSDDALVPQDVNGTQDAYQYEPAGIGDCTVSGPAFSERSGGCVGLISSGTSAQESAFLDASETGGDVFFLTTAKLAPQASGAEFDVYDAHECAEQAPCFARAPVSPPPCSTGDSCKPAPSPQPEIFGSPSSATFSGAGNIVAQASRPAVAPRSLTRSQKLSKALKACHKKKNKRKRAACEKQARKSYGAKASGAGKSRKANASKRGRG